MQGPSGDFTAHLLNRDSPKHSSVKTQFLSTWLKNDDGNPRFLEDNEYVCYYTRQTKIVFISHTTEKNAKMSTLL